MQINYSDVAEKMSSVCRNYSVAGCFLLLAASLVSCGSNTGNRVPESEPQTQPAGKINLAKPQCYEWKEKNSSAIARFTVINDTVSGTLEYLFSEKDNSKGTIFGVMRGDTLFADYRFTSEGRVSVMEVIFLMQGSMLVQGHGPMRQEGPKMVYVQPNRVEFSTGFKGRICN